MLFNTFEFLILARYKSGPELVRSLPTRKICGEDRQSREGIGKSESSAGGFAPNIQKGLCEKKPAVGM